MQMLQLPRGRGVFTIHGTSIYRNIWGSEHSKPPLKRCIARLFRKATCSSTMRHAYTNRYQYANMPTPTQTTKSTRHAMAHRAHNIGGIVKFVSAFGPQSHERARVRRRRLRGNIGVSAFRISAWQQQFTESSKFLKRQALSVKAGATQVQSTACSCARQQAGG
eukprot:scaffold199513_cov35-Tisochrysis_lutea.AAC.1